MVSGGILESKENDLEVPIEEELKFHHQTPLAGAKSLKIVGLIKGALTTWINS